MKRSAFKVFFWSILVMLPLLEVHAQDGDPSNEKTWSIGPELGVNFSKYGRDADDSDYNSGLIAGGFITYSIRNTHAFTAKVLFSQKGAKSDDPNISQHLR